MERAAHPEEELWSLLRSVSEFLVSAAAEGGVMGCGGRGGKQAPGWPSPACLGAARDWAGAPRARQGMGRALGQACWQGGPDFQTEPFCPPFLLTGRKGTREARLRHAAVCGAWHRGHLEPPAAALAWHFPGHSSQPRRVSLGLLLLCGSCASGLPSARQSEPSAGCCPFGWHLASRCVRGCLGVGTGMGQGVEGSPGAWLA